MNKDRIKKLESMSREIISKLIFEEIDDSENIFGIITITDIVISSDLSYLDVWVSAFKNTEILAKTLATHNHGIQSKYNKAIGIRKLPKIRYRYDSKGEVGQKICEAINKVI
ncbi:MAG: ribosome-binding factor A [Candidatus Gracilibacteria bacterium]|nr:ribosome-binding factor A [Candidatus Gracilibacteria bacterium]